MSGEPGEPLSADTVAGLYYVAFFMYGMMRDA